MKRWIIGLLVMVCLLGGCSSNSNTSVKSGSQMNEGEAALEDKAYGMEDYDAGGLEYASEDAVTAETTAPSDIAQVDALAGKKLIKTVNISAETMEFDQITADLTDWVNQANGYIENSSVSGRGRGSDSLRYASYTLRIPAEQLETFLTTFETSVNILNRNDSTKDVTLAYTDLESHKEALTVERERLMELLEKAETMEDILAIESKLTDIRYELEYYQRQLLSYDNLVTYSTITLSLQEVKEETQDEPESFFGRIGAGFINSIKNIGSGITDTVASLIIVLPYFVLIGIIVVILYVILRRIRRKKKGVRRDKHSDDDQSQV